MKSVIIRDIIKLVTCGIEELYNIPEKLFLKWLTKFNRQRNLAPRIGFNRYINQKYNNKKTQNRLVRC